MVKRTFQYTLTRPRRRLKRLPSTRTQKIEGKAGTWLVPSIEDAVACKNVGGRWEKTFKVCMLREGPDGGWTAPVKGAYFAYSVSDMYDATGNKYYKGVFMPNVMGCLVADSFVYPTFARGCSAIYESEMDEEHGKKEALRMAKEEAMEIASDVLRGKADYWFMDYYSTTGREVPYDAENAIVSNDPKHVINVFRKGRGERPLTEFKR